MMKLLGILVLILSLPLTAQIRTGGGTVDVDPLSIDSPNEGGSAPDPISKDIRAYTNHLKEREKECRSNGMRYLDIDPDFMQIYLKLSVLKSTFVADNQCADSKAYFKCLSDDKAQEKLKVLVKNRKMYKYMKENYGTSKKDAKNILKFFEELDKGCPGDTCQQ